MPNILDADGLQVASVTEIQNNLTVGYQSIYGADINVGPNSPDGQLIGILAQNISDTLQLLVQVYNSFAVDSSFGVILDQRVAMSGIFRQQGTYTQAIVLVTVSQALNLVGQDALTGNPNAQVFTVADDVGNQFQLKASHSFGGAGSASLTFQSVVIGQIQTTPNTIQTIFTTQQGVTSVNNPTTAGDTEGLPEETDPQLKIRQANSYYLQAVGPADAIRAALLNVPDISDAYVVDNDSGSTVNTVPAHSVWVIVNGGTNVEIAQVIYAKKSAGCGMKGSVTQNVVRPQGNTFTAQWDAAVSQPLYVQAILNPRIPGVVFDTVSDEQDLADALIYKLGQSPNIGDVILAMQVIEPGAVLSAVQVSTDGVTWEDIVSPTTAQNYFLTLAANVTLTNA